MDKRRLKAGFLVTLAFMLGTVVPCVSAYATMPEVMLEMFAQNNILFYDPYGSNACVDAGSPNYQVVDPSTVYINADDNASAIRAISSCNYW